VVPECAESAGRLSGQTGERRVGRKLTVVRSGASGRLTSCAVAERMARRRPRNGWHTADWQRQLLPSAREHPRGGPALGYVPVFRRSGGCRIGCGLAPRSPRQAVASRVSLLTSLLFVDVVTTIRGSADPKSRHHVNKANRRGGCSHRDEVTVRRVRREGRAAAASPSPPPETRQRRPNTLPTDPGNA
jgi:hypothetical protein